MWYSTLKNYYELGFYTLENMKIFVKAKYINDIQYKEITGKDYSNQ